MKKFYKVVIGMAIAVMTLVSVAVVGYQIGNYMTFKADMTKWVEATGEEMDDEMLGVYDKYGINVCLVLHDIQEEAEMNRARYKYEFTQKSNGQMYLTCNIEGQREPIVYEILNTVD